jgi:hypothetical protein
MGSLQRAFDSWRERRRLARVRRIQRRQPKLEIPPPSRPRITARHRAKGRSFRPMWRGARPMRRIEHNVLILAFLLSA